MACNRNTINCPITKANRPPCCIEGFKNLLFYITDLLDKNDITYWLDYGTLLGAVRNGEIIPWDSDIDLGTLGTEVEKIWSLRNQILEDGYDFRVHQLSGTKSAQASDIIVPEESHTIYVFYSKINKLSLEIPVWDTNPKPGYAWQYTRRWYGACERASGKAFSKLYVHPCDEIEMYGRKFSIPDKVEQFLEHRYGHNWRTPTNG